MAIITRNVSLLRGFAFFTVAITATATLAQERRTGFTVTAGANAEVIHQTISAEQFGNRSLNTLQISPRVNAFYQSRTFSGLWTGSVTHLDQGSDNFAIRDTYEEYSYTANWQPFDRLLSFQASGALRYQNAFAGNFLINDFLNDQGQLVKSRSNQLASTLTLDQGDWFRGSGTLSYAQLRSEQNPLFQGLALNNDVYSAQGQLVQGDRVRHLTWRLQGSFQSAEQGQGVGVGGIGGVGPGQGRFTNRNIIGDMDVLLSDHWALRLTGQHEGNQLANQTETFREVRQFDTYGVGITYRVRNDRFIAITANRVNSDIEENDGDNFIGLDMNWAFTERTGLQARYTRRFFGESGNVAFRYNTKHIRTNLSYTEDVTSNVILLANPENLGVFVCPAGNATLANCFQPNSLNYQPQAGEQLVQLSTQNLELNDNVILRKALNAQLGYMFSRVTLGLFGIYSEETFLNVDAIRRTISGGGDITYQLGAYTDVNARVSYAEIAQRGSGEGGGFAFGFLGPGDNRNWNATLQIRRTLGQHLSANLSASYIDQSGDVPLGLFGANFADRRITLGLQYRYE